MLNLGKFCLIICLFQISASLAQQNTELVLLQIVFRHGDRTPVTTYPTDPYNSSTWDKYGGLGQLTQTGMQQHHEYGLFLRERYSKFLNKYYDKNEVYVRSTDYDRTQMSAASLLSGLYSPVDYQVWNANVSWQPIPIHTNDADIIFSNPDKCDRYNQLKFEVVETDEYKKLSAQYQDLIDLAVKEGGFTKMNLMDMWMLSDDVFVQVSHNLTQPKWINDNLARLMELRDVDFYLDFRTTEMGKLASGGILNEVKKNILNKSKNQNSKNQLFLFSSHDTYVAGLTRLLNLTEELRQPPYASAIIFELRKDSKNSFFIQVYQKNNTANEEIKFNPMTIYGCDELCPLDRFIEIIKDKTVDDFSTVCKKVVPKVSLYSTTLIVSLSFVALIGFILIGYAIKTCRTGMDGYQSYERQIL